MSGSRNVTATHCKFFILSNVCRVLFDIPKRKLLKTTVCFFCLT